MHAGLLIALEGLDGSGTTTQARALSMALRARGHTVLETREPTDGGVGRLLRAQLQTSRPPHIAMALMFAADRALHVAEVIEPALSRGEVVVCDRYLLSSWVYQSLDCPPDWVRAINRHAPWPTLTALLSVSSETGMRRLSQRDAPREVFETESIQRRVERGYAELLEEDLPGVVAIDGSQTPSEVTERLLNLCRGVGL